MFCKDTAYVTVMSIFIWKQGLLIPRKFTPKNRGLFSCQPKTSEIDVKSDAKAVMFALCQSIVQVIFLGTKD